MTGFFKLHIVIGIKFSKNHATRKLANISGISSGSAKNAGSEIAPAACYLFTNCLSGRVSKLVNAPTSFHEWNL
jgi:hypothetical protein